MDRGSSKGSRPSVRARPKATSSTAWSRASGRRRAGRLRRDLPEYCGPLRLTQVGVGAAVVSARIPVNRVGRIGHVVAVQGRCPRAHALDHRWGGRRSGRGSGLVRAVRKRRRAASPRAVNPLGPKVASARSAHRPERASRAPWTRAPTGSGRAAPRGDRRTGPLRRDPRGADRRLRTPPPAREVRSRPLRQAVEPRVGTHGVAAQELAAAMDGLRIAWAPDLKGLHGGAVPGVRAVESLCIGSRVAEVTDRGVSERRG